MREDPSVDFVSVRDAGRASPCLVSNNSKRVATSSGEAEFHALTKSASRALGAVALYEWTPRRRRRWPRGAGRVRHFHTQVLWVPEAVARGERTIARVHRVQQPCQLGTKHLALREMYECMRRAGCQTAGGRSRLALRSQRSGRLEPATLGYENDKSITDCEIKDRLRTSRMPTTSRRRNQTTRIQSTPC